MLGRSTNSTTALPMPSTVDQRQRDLDLLRSSYDFKTASVPNFVVNKTPIPVAEFPHLSWISCAVSSIVAQKLNLIIGRRRIRGLRVGNDRLAATASPTFLERIQSFASYVSTVFSFSSAARAGDMEACIAIQAAVEKEVNALKRETEEAVLEARKMVRRGSEREFDDDDALVPSEFLEGIEESVEKYGTRDYRALVGLSNLPKEERQYFEHFDSDAAFARARVAGLNPMSLRAVTQEDLAGAKTGSWKATDEHLRAAARGGGSDTDGFVAQSLEKDSIQECIRQNRLYMLEYPWLSDVTHSKEDDRHVFVPKAVFVVPMEEKERAKVPMVPVVIWIYKQGDPMAKARVYTPADGFAWHIAKLIVSVLDANDHEYYRHLILTHLLMEPFGISLKRQLHEKHPIHRLLRPHFYGTIFVNWSATNFLISKGDIVDMGLITPVNQVADELANKMATVRFNSLFLENDLAARNVNSPILSYPYRDYARELWTALSAWVCAYVDEFYSNDAEIVADNELQAWAKEIVATDEIKLRDFGDKTYLDGSSSYVITTKSYLCDALTMIIFTTSCQHSAMNFAQGPFLSYAPSWPLSTRMDTLPEAPSSGGSMTDWKTWRKWLPSIRDTEDQWYTNQVLASVYYTKLGDYPREVSDGLPNVKKALDELRNSLDIIGKKMEEREKKSRIPYLVLHPSKIPASINI